MKKLPIVTTDLPSQPDDDTILTIKRSFPDV